MKYDIPFLPPGTIELGKVPFNMARYVTNCAICASIWHKKRKNVPKDWKIS